MRFKLFTALCALSVGLFAVSCQDGKSGAVADFEIITTDGHNITLKSLCSGDYEILQWSIEGIAPIKNVDEVSHYYPKVGSYRVGVELWAGGERIASKSENFVVTSQDPNYEMTLVWEDNFDGNELSSSWVNETGYIANDELQDYQASGNHEVSDGTLKITAKLVNEDKVFGSYTSARIKTQGIKEFTYGRVESRMKLPQGVGLWPAFWMLGGNIGTAGWPLCGEIDIMEFVGFEPTTIHVNLHMEDYNHALGNNYGSRETLENTADWHTYGITWTEDYIEFYIDDHTRPFYRVEAISKGDAGSWPFDSPHFLLLNLAVGGSWGGLQGIDNTIFPATMEVDYVRVYQYQ